MVKSEISGVTFSADPVSGNQDVIITEASWGMGAAIVDGRVSPDRFVTRKSSGALESSRIADKRFMVPAMLPEGSSSRLSEVPAYLRQAQTLDEKHLKEVSDLARKAENHFGSPQDIEWAISDGKLYMLQSRPVTTLSDPTEVPVSGRYILFKPLAENFTDPLLPVTQDLLGRFVPFLKLFHGRVYLNLDHIGTLIPAMPNTAMLSGMYFGTTPRSSATIPAPAAAEAIAPRYFSPQARLIALFSSESSGPGLKPGK